jgi:hypothetical protein
VAASDTKGLPTHVVELKDLVVAYAKQETIEPIKGLGKFIAMGVAGSFMLSIGLVLLVLALLRALQTETGDTLDRNLSWVPYLITLVACAVVAALAARAIGAAKRRRERSRA